MPPTQTSCSRDYYFSLLKNIMAHGHREQCGDCRDGRLGLVEVEEGIWGDKCQCKKTTQQNKEKNHRQLASISLYTFFKKLYGIPVYKNALFIQSFATKLEYLSLKTKAVSNNTL